MRHETTRELFRYWNSVRKERASPERDEIDPASIRDILADTFILENKPDGTFRIRLSGTRLDALWLADQKGRCFLDFWADDRETVADALWTVMDAATPVVLGAQAAPRGRPAAPAEGLLLPLRHHGRTHSLILGAFSLAKPPSWIGLVPVERLKLASFRMIAPADIERPRRHGWGEMPAGSILERRAHLTVYAGGR